MFVGCVVEENAAIQQYINSDDILHFEDHVVFSFMQLMLFPILFMQSNEISTLYVFHLILIQNNSLFWTCHNWIITYFHCYLCG